MFNVFFEGIAAKKGGLEGVEGVVAAVVVDAARCAWAFGCRGCLAFSCGGQTRPHCFGDDSFSFK